MRTEDIERFINVLAVPTILIDHNSRVAASNPGANSLFGAVAVGRHYITAFRQPQLLDCLDAAIETSSVQTARLVIVVHAQDRSFDIQASPMEMAEGVAILVSFMDTTQVEAAGQIRRDFVANVSHELRTPLTALAGFIETLQGAARDDAKARDRFLAIMARETDRMNRLVQDLLSLSRVEGDERKHPTESVDIGQTVLAAVAQMRRLAQDNTVEIDVVEMPHDVHVAGDPDQLLQVFLNLLENAIKYGKSGERVHVEVSLPEREPSLRAPAVRIDVIDFGDGVDSVHLPRLTERFYRVDDHRSREMGGTGLGLAIVKHIVNRHRGRLQVNSTLGQGSTFSVILPIE